ncbi:MAG: hypothetical protein CSA81_09755 [Acidobacteria bacterium]|nr:MAG: hypothetical protein CSA81_09755 [Acidobacteriota bacterium]
MVKIEKYSALTAKNQSFQQHRQIFVFYTNGIFIWIRCCCVENRNGILAPADASEVCRLVGWMYNELSVVKER